jgi:hypothetical protein
VRSPTHHRAQPRREPLKRTQRDTTAKPAAKRHDSKARRGCHGGTGFLRYATPACAALNRPKCANAQAQSVPDAPRGRRRSCSRTDARRTEARRRTMQCERGALGWGARDVLGRAAFLRGWGGSQNSSRARKAMTGPSVVPVGLCGTIGAV